MDQRSSRLGVLDVAEIETLDGTGTSDWCAREATLIDACDDCARSMQIGEPAWATLEAHYSEVEILDIVFTIGQYALIAIALETVGVELDEGLTMPVGATPNGIV